MRAAKRSPFWSNAILRVGGVEGAKKSVQFFVISFRVACALVVVVEAVLLGELHADRSRPRLMRETNPVSTPRERERGDRVLPGAVGRQR